jgi:hypothetical protein
MVSTFAYRLFFLLHVGFVVVGFGSSFVYPVLAAKARSLDERASFAVSKLSFDTAKVVTTPCIYAAAVCGIILIPLSESLFKFSQLWISLAFVLFIAAALIAGLLHMPNLKAMTAIQERLANGEIAPPAEGGAPKEVIELQERASRAGMYGGLLHVLWLLLMIDMIWKPGLSVFGS